MNIKSTAVGMLCLLMAASAAQGGEPVRRIAIDATGPTTPRDHFYDLSVGADFPGTLRRDDSLAQLRTVTAELKFRYLRFHGIFHDVLGVYREVDGKPVYDWSKVDQLYDELLKAGIKPFVELSFTPAAMKSSDNSVFVWKANTSQPDPHKWVGLVDAFVRHLLERYGQAEVRSWFFEVWNEPNLTNFWQGADRKAYFDLYERTVKVIKAIDPVLRVGGPATAEDAWVPEFIANAHANNIPLDFISTHTYGVEGGFLDESGRQYTKLSPNPLAIVGTIRKAREEIATSAMPSLPLYFTEWSSSYSSRDPVHDSYVNAPYILSKIKASTGQLQGMSYWTYSDLFEEAGPPPTPFHGGFGLLNREGIRKPSYFVYKYLAALGDAELASTDPQSYVTMKGRTVAALIWDFKQPVQNVDDRKFYGKVLPASEAAPVRLELKHLTPGRYRVKVYRTGFRANDALTAYLEMGAPRSLDKNQLSRLEDLTSDQPELAGLTVDKSGKATYTVNMRENDIVLVAIASEKSGDVE